MDRQELEHRYTISSPCKPHDSGGQSYKDPITIFEPCHKNICFLNMRKGADKLRGSAAGNHAADQHFFLLPG